VISVLALAVIGVVTGTRQRLQPVRPLPSVSDDTTPAETPVDQPAGGLSLNLRRDGKMLRVLWDRSSPVIRETTQADMYITDGDRESKLRLSNAAIRSGMLSYWPESEDVTFRLEALADGRVITASVQTGSGRPGPSPAVADSAAPVTSAKAEPPPIEPPEKPEPTASKKPERPEQTKSRNSRANRRNRQSDPQTTTGSADRSTGTPESHVASAGTATTLAPLPAISMPKKATLPPPVIPPAPTHRSMPSTKASGVTSVAEPASPSRLRRVAGRVPFVRRLKKFSEPRPPKPVHQVMPVISAADRRALVLPLSLSVMVEVDPSGQVASVEPAGSGDWGSPYAVAAVSAARHWKFDPARNGDEKVPGKVILRFRFEPTNQ
jgi:hypothetical protein